MAYMTEEEADSLDEELTRNTPKVDFSKPDIFIKQRELLNLLKPAAADYIMTRALATHQTPVQIIGELIGEKIAAAV
ncbi:MAG: hypothetical protein LBC76_03535 [Treponema sp.]|jgi:hypothetical protein|nr:hypothetical protein [Treponema sp.]